MIVGTAGHIDHGKTTLVRALAGDDTHPLPQEAPRGAGIEIGHAYIDAPRQPGETAAPPRIGFIDMPGHERLLPLMLASAAGIDHALLLVAADEGVMPQTREHLAVLSLLGLGRGSVVISKSDRVDAARLASLRAEVEALLAPTPLAGAALHVVSATTGEGVAALREALFQAARDMPPRGRAGEAFRLAVDRAFTLEGEVTVVTGTVHAGMVRVGDPLQLLPAALPVSARVRSLHAQQRAADRAQAGGRCAVSLVGIPGAQVLRGQWLVAPEAAQASDRLDVELQLWHEEARPLRSGTTVQVHLGAQEVIGTVALLSGPGPAGPGGSAAGLEPGAKALAQLVLREPVGAWHGDRVVLRDVSARRTVAGGRVLDPLGPQRERRSAQRLAELDAWSQATPAARLAALLAASPMGMECRRWRRSEGLLALPATAPAAGAIEAVDEAGHWLLSADHAVPLRAAVLDALARCHAQQPQSPGPDAPRLRRLAAPLLAEPLWRALLQALVHEGLLQQRGACVQLPEHGLQQAAVEARLAQRLVPLLEQAGAQGARARDLARDAQEPEPLVRAVLARWAERGEVHPVLRDLHCSRRAMAALVSVVRDAAAGGVDITMPVFCERTGLRRQRANQVLAYLERVGVLRRVGEVCRPRGDSKLFREEPA